MILFYVQSAFFFALCVGLAHWLFLSSRLAMKQHAEILLQRRARERKGEIWDKLGLQKGWLYKHPFMPEDTPPIRFRLRETRGQFAKAGRTEVHLIQGFCGGAKEDGVACSDEEPLREYDADKSKSVYYCTQCKRALSNETPEHTRQRATGALHGKIRDVMEQLERDGEEKKK